MFAIVVKVHMSMSGMPFSLSNTPPLVGASYTHQKTVEAFVLAGILKGCSEDGFPIYWATCYWCVCLSLGIYARSPQLLSL